MTGRNSGLNKRTKLKHLEQLADYRENTLRPNPDLRTLFIEMTTHCNEHCRHCGSNCGDVKEEGALSGDEIKAFLAKLKKEIQVGRLKLSITGGEPLLRADFFDIMDYAHKLGYQWGMTSNGLLITPEVAHKLHMAGMRTVSISLDGLRENHEWFRQVPGSYDRSVQGIKNLLNEGGFDHVQITTVVNHRNYGELEAMYKEFSGIGVRSWRVINIEPIGRAKGDPELMLTPDEYRGMFRFIESHRFAGPMEVCYGCSHYLGVETEREVRKWYFLCNAGVYTASVAYNGDILACLDIERRPELVQGNIRCDNFMEIWKNGYEIFRTDFRKTGPCAECEHYRYCAGDAFHTWNFDGMRPDLCMKGILF